MTTLVERIVVHAEREFPDYVYWEILNWVRVQWWGKHPGPPKIAQEAAACDWPPVRGYLDEDDGEWHAEPNFARARIVESVYRCLPPIERRIVQEEYTRRGDYRDIPAHLRIEAACRKLGVQKIYYETAIYGFRKKVMEVFA